MGTYFFTYLCSALLAILITPVIILLARRLNMLDFLNARKVHFKPIPRIGGTAIFTAATIMMIAMLFLDNSIGEAIRSVKNQVLALLAAGAFIFLTGLIDDLYGLRARYKLLAQIIAATGVCIAGVQIKSLNVANLFTIDFGWLSIPITVFWIISITNAVNLIDGLDGLAAGISAIACAIIAIFAFTIAQNLMVIFMLALLGSLSGFLLFNFNPARIFLGDCGSMYLGFILASTSVMCAIKSGTMVALALPAIALGLPIFDTIFSVLRRYIGRWGIMSADRGHLHHKLLDMGLRHRHVVLIMYAITILAAGLGMFMMITSGGGTVAIFICEIMLLLLIFRAFNTVHLREIIAKLRYNKVISNEAKKDVDVFEDTHLKFHKTMSFKEWWQAVSEMAEKEGFLELCLTATAKSGRSHRFIWHRRNGEQNQDEIISMRLPIGGHRFGLPMRIEAKMSANGLLESAGRRMMLFGRLIDEYSITNPSNNEENASILELRKTKQSFEAKREPSTAAAL